MKQDALSNSLASPHKTLCHAWLITKGDGSSLGFTDHDLELSFEGTSFKPSGGFSASALLKTTGLAIDNSEVLGAITNEAIQDDDIEAGQYDGSEVKVWLVNWSDPRQRRLEFTGFIGEIQRKGSLFQAELRGLSAALNRPMGRVYQAPCSAVLGDKACRFDLAKGGFHHQCDIETVEDDRILRFSDLAIFDNGWFTKGKLEVRSGAAKGQVFLIKSDAFEGQIRIIELWETVRTSLKAGDKIKLFVGCDKAFKTCRLKFNNVVNFRGFPDIPPEDWIAIDPSQAISREGASRR